MKSLQWVVLIALVVGVAFLRVLPHPPNFTPMMAIALFSGAIFGRRGYAYLLPIGAMVLSDLLIGFHSLSGVVYVSMVPAIWFGAFLGGVKPLGDKQSAFGFKWAGAGLSADLSFFVLSNLGVWWLSGFYERSVAGLTECFVLALPFLINQIFGTATFLGLLLFSWYGLQVLAGWREPKLSFKKYKD